MTDNLIVIFTRNPELGKVKTRLAKTIGDESALNVYKFLLAHTETQIRHINADKAVYYSENIASNDLWDALLYQKHKQVGSHLGERMKYAFETGFNQGYKRILIIGSDLYDLKSEHINQAFDELNTNDIVIGPALDGGYYLLGMTALHKAVFEDKAWGTGTVLQDTLKSIPELKTKFLSPLNDIDTFKDLQPYTELNYLYSNA